MKKLGLPVEPTDRYGLTLSVHEVKNLNCLIGNQQPAKVKESCSTTTSSVAPNLNPIHVGNVFELEEILSPIHTPRNIVS